MGLRLGNLKTITPKKAAFYFALLFGGVGLALLLYSSAAAPSASFEAEAGTVTSPAEKISSQAQASGSSYVRFGAQVAPPPTFSGILFGSNRPDEADANLTAAETQLGRKFDIVRIFHSSWSTSFTKELQYANQGKVVHTSFKLWGTWRQVSTDIRTAGSARRAEVEALATNMQAQMPGPFFLTLHHEPEDDVDAANGRSEQDYADMFCAFYFVFKSKGATKAKFAPVAIPIPHYDSNQSKGAKMYPGDQCVDWNGVDPYNFFTHEKLGNWRTMEQIMKNLNADGTSRAATGWYQWATRDFTGVSCSVVNNSTCYGSVTKLDGTTEPKQVKGKKPIIVGEWGSVEYYDCVSPECNTPHAGDATKKAAWIRQAVSDFRDKLPQVKAIQYWGAVSVSAGATEFHCFGNDTRFNTTLPANLSCSTVIADVPLSYTGPSFQAFKDISDEPYFNITAGLAEGTATSAAAQKRFEFVNAQ